MQQRKTKVTARHSFERPRGHWARAPPYSLPTTISTLPSLRCTLDSTHIHPAAEFTCTDRLHIYALTFLLLWRNNSLKKLNNVVFYSFPMLVQTCMILCGPQNDIDSHIRLSLSFYRKKRKVNYDRVRHSSPAIMTNIPLCVPQKKKW